MTGVTKEEIINELKSKERYEELMKRLNVFLINFFLLNMPIKYVLLNKQVFLRSFFIKIEIFFLINYFK